MAELKPRMLYSRPLGHKWLYVLYRSLLSCPAARLAMTVDEDSFNPNWRLWSIFGVVGLLNFAAALDATSLSVALPVC